MSVKKRSPPFPVTGIQGNPAHPSVKTPGARGHPARLRRLPSTGALTLPGFTGMTERHACGAYPFFLPWWSWSAVRVQDPFCRARMASTLAREAEMVVA